MRTLHLLSAVSVLVIASSASAAPDKKPPVTPPPATAQGAGTLVTTPTTAAPTTSVKAADERTVSAGPSARPVGRVAGREGVKRPEMRGPRLPEEVRKKLRAQLDARVERDLQAIRELRKEAIGLLTTFVDETPKEAREMPEALMRLGELTWETEREAVVDRFRAWEKLPEATRGPAPDPNYGPARALFARVLRDYPWFSQYDLALYVDGFLATEQGKLDEAQARFDRILRDHPRSRFVPDAHMSRAELLFSQKSDYVGALAEYEEVLKFKDSELYGLALFKSAWCLWRLGRSEEAAKRFVGVFEVTDSNKVQGESKKKQLDELQAEALKYLVEVFTEDEKNTASDVYGFLTKIGGDRFAGKVVRALATQFYDQAHYERGIEAYELLLKLEPTSPDAGRWVLQIADGQATLEDWPKLRNTYARALAGYTTGSSWSKAQGDPQNVADTQKQIETHLREHALQLHAKGQKDKSRTELEGAAGLYEVYLSKFAQEKNAYQIEFYVGEIQFHRLGKNTEAATHYMAAARGIPQSEANVEPQKTLRHDALYNAIAALERVRVTELEARKGKPQGAYQETEADKKFAEALELYAQLYPQDPALPELLFRQGRLYYDYGVYDPAVKILGSLVEKFPNSQFSQGAGELILDSFNKSKNYENIEVWARRLKATPSFASAAQQARLDTLIVQAVFKQGEQKSAANDHAGAAQAYLRAAREFPKDPRAAQACVNAELSAQKAGDVTTLKEAAKLVTSREYATRPEAPQGAWIAASTLQAMGLFGDAADLHEAIAQNADKDHPNYQKFEHTKDAGYNAVVLRVATGEHDKAIAAGNKYLAVWGSSAEADEVVFEMGRAHQNAGRNKEAVDLYRRYVGRTKNLDHRVQGLVLLAMAQQKTDDEKGSDLSLKEAVSLGRQRGRELGADGKFYAAKARYMEGEKILRRFDQIQIQGDVKQLSARLKQKAELLKAASTVFLDTVSLGVAEWTTAALYQIGRTYESFAKALRDAPPPSNLSDADKEAYQTQIDEFVVPIEERSLDAYENGWKKAIELGIYNQWTAKMREALGRLNAELYPPFVETGFDVRSKGPAALPAFIDAPRRGGAPAKPPAAASPAPAPAPAPAPVPAKGAK
ncbi:MAG: tetratricopeptide repeat protein [Myxococcales bacterium]|nr:tetratricopeptide repeat protein [Myxococcales bacterium]